MLYAEIQAELIQEEGLSLKVYIDSLGNKTIGVGHRVYDDTQIITLELASQYLRSDIDNAYQICREIPCFNSLDGIRQYPLISMAFNMGKKIYSFKKMIKALENRDYELASYEMKNSLWHNQVKTRALKLEGIMRTGHL